MIAYEATNERILKKDELNKLIEESEKKIISIKKELGIILDDDSEEDISSKDNKLLSNIINTPGESKYPADIEPDIDICSLSDEEDDFTWDE